VHAPATRAAAAPCAAPTGAGSRCRFARICWRVCGGQVPRAGCRRKVAAAAQQDQISGPPCAHDPNKPLHANHPNKHRGLHGVRARACTKVPTRACMCLQKRRVAELQEAVSAPAMHTPSIAFLSHIPSIALLSTRQQGCTILIFTRICMRVFVGDNRVQRNDAAGPPRQQGFMRAGVVLSLPLAPPLAPPASSLSLSLPHPLALSLLLPLSCSFTHSLLPSLSTHMVPVRARIGAGTKSRLHLRAPTTVYRSEG